MKKKYFIILVLLAAVVALPFLVRKEAPANLFGDEERVVIASPHNETVKYEFGEGFSDWYFRKTGKKVKVDWRSIGTGTPDIIKFIDSQYTAAFRNYWENVLKREWTQEVQDAFSKRENHARYPENSLVSQVYKVFMESNVGCDMDIFFGGGDVDVVAQSKKGQLDTLEKLIEMHPDWFMEEVMPLRFQGCYLRDPNHKWIGTAISGFDLIYNIDVLKKIGIEVSQLNWSNLADEKFFGTVALADPTISGSFTRAFEVIYQLYMQSAFNELKAQANGRGEKEIEMQAVAEGWYRGMQVIQNISANARYFTDSSAKAIMDVASGNCAVGMTVDFYGLIEIENLRQRDGVDRMGIVVPLEGTSLSADPVAIFKGAPHPELAFAFAEYVVSIEGQKLWDFKVGASGGPKRYQLGRAPVNKKLYEPEYVPYRSNPQLNYYVSQSDFEYRPQWTADALFKQMRFVIKVACIDTHPELVTAWKAIIDARAAGRHMDADKAFAVMQDVRAIDYVQITGPIRKVLEEGTWLDRIKLQGALSKYFSNQYRLAEKIAKGKEGV